MSITLRELERADLPTLNAWRNDESLMASLGNNFLFITSAVDDAWFEGYLAARDKAVRLSILSDGRYIGNVNLTSIHAINRSAEYSIMIGAAGDRGKGAGALATQHILRHGFADRGLNRIYLTVLSDNVAAIRMYEKVGFRREGIKRQDVFKNGRFHDMVMMSILREEFAA